MSSRGSRWIVRLPVLIATTVAMVVSLPLMYFMIASIHSRNDLRAGVAENMSIARIISSEAAGGASNHFFSSVENLLMKRHMRATITINGHRMVVGVRLPTGSQLAKASTPIGAHGSVSVSSVVDTSADPPLLVMSAGTLAVFVVLGVALSSSGIAGRQARRRVEQVIVGAQSLSNGDFTARIGASGPEPLDVLGKAFDTMAARLEQIDVEQREFLANFAHEIATPIHAVIGYANAILDGTIPRDAAKGAINIQNRRLNELLDELSQLRSLDAPVERVPVLTPIDQLVDRVIEELMPLAIEVQVVKHLEPVAAATVPELLAAIIRNFITNALRFTPSGGIVTVTTARKGLFALVSVRDNGPGIPTEHQDRIFDRFYRTETARDRVRGGSGLGLAIARRSSIDIGATIEVESELGSGSEFRLILPLNWT